MIAVTVVMMQTKIVNELARAQTLIKQQEKEKHWKLAIVEIALDSFSQWSLLWGICRTIKENFYNGANRPIYRKYRNWL